MGFPCERARHKNKNLYKQREQKITANSNCQQNIGLTTSAIKLNGVQHIFDTFQSTQDFHTIGNVVISRLSQLINYKRSSKSAAASTSNYLVRQSLCLYAASSVILVLCYLTTPASAVDVPHPM